MKSNDGALRLDFDRRVMLQFRGFGRDLRCRSAFLPIANSMTCWDCRRWRAMRLGLSVISLNFGLLIGISAGALSFIPTMYKVDHFRRRGAARSEN